MYQPYADRPERHQGPGGPTPSPYITSTPQTQLEADEIYARQLADQFGVPKRAGTGMPRPGASTTLDPEYETGRRRGRLHDPDSDYDSDKEHSFLDGLYYCVPNVWLSPAYGLRRSSGY